MSVKVPALLSGVSAANGDPITNQGGYVHNNALPSLKATDPRVLPTITADGILLTQDGLTNGRAYFYIDLGGGNYYTCAWDGVSDWVFADQSGTIDSSTTDSPLPSETGWGFIIVTHTPNPTKWVDTNGQFTENSFADLTAWDQDSYKERTSTEDATYIRDILTYSEASTGQDLAQLNAYLESRE